MTIYLVFYRDVVDGWTDIKQAFDNEEAANLYKDQLNKKCGFIGYHIMIMGLLSNLPEVI